MGNSKEKIIFGLAIFGAIVIWTGLGTPSFKYSIIIGIFLILPLLIYFLQIKKENKRENKEINLLKENLIKNGKQVIVDLDLDKIKILTNSWQEEIVVDRTKYAYINDLTGNSEKNIENVEIIQSTLLLDIPYKGEEIKISVNTDIDPTTLKMKLAMKNSTILYVDRENKNRFYLDLNFLEE